MRTSLLLLVISCGVNGRGVEKTAVPAHPLKTVLTHFTLISNSWLERLPQQADTLTVTSSTSE